MAFLVSRPRAFHKSCLRILFLAQSSSLLFCFPVHAIDLPSPRLDRVFPLGGAAGSVVEVEIVGADLEGPAVLLIPQPGFTIEPVAEQERKFRITIAPDVPVGTYDVYASGRFGISNSRRFAVTHRLQTIADDGKNHERSTAQRVEVNTVVDGMIDGNSEDFFLVTLAVGQRVLFDCEAQRLDSPLDGVLSLTDISGRSLTTSSDEIGHDPRIDFVAPAAGDYIVGVNDLSYRGGFPYRLTITDLPTVENLFPAAIQIGASQSREVLGRNLQSLGGQPSNWSEDGLPLEKWGVDLRGDEGVFALRDYRFADHPSAHSVAPTAATCTLSGDQIRLGGIETLWSSPAVLLTEHRVLSETEPNDSLDQSNLVELPLVMGGRLNQPRDIDRFKFSVPEQGGYLINVYCERLAGRADMVCVLLDTEGKRIQELDDFGHRMNAFDGHLRDPSQEINLEPNREYQLLLQDRYGRGGPRYHYVLEVVKAEADFFPAVIHRSNPNPAGTTVFRSTATYLDLVIHHRGNARGAVTITGGNLPPGLHVATTTIPNDTRGVVVLWADDDAPEWTGPIDLIATTEIDGQVIRRRVRPYARVRSEQGSSVPTREMMVAIREQGPFDLSIEPTMVEAEAGSTVTAQLRLRRLWLTPDRNDDAAAIADYSVTIQPLAFPGGFQLGNFDIAAGTSQAELKIAIQDNTRPGTYTLSVLGQAQVPFNKDPQASDHPVTLVSAVSRPITIVVKPKSKE